MTERLENTPETFKKLISEANEYKDKYLRTYAEMENVKKRVERDKVTAIKFANESFAKEFLHTVDDVEKLLDIDMPSIVKECIEAIYNKLQHTMTKFKIVECETKIFDPSIHEAVSFVESYCDEKRIAQVLRKGYLMDGRLLRPASVIVEG